MSDREAERRYLELLQLAADHGLDRVGPALQDLVTAGGPISREKLVKTLGLEAPTVPDFVLDAKAALEDYDAFIPGAPKEAQR